MNASSIQPLPVVMTTDEVAALLRCPTATVERYVFNHQLVAVRIGRERRFRALDVLDFVASRPITTKCGKRHLRRRAAHSDDRA